jgi:hypothetical protein
MSRNSRKETVWNENEQEIELQISTMLEFKYYGILYNVKNVQIGDMRISRKQKTCDMHRYQR